MAVGTLDHLAGTLADRYGRRPLLVATILFYSIFAGLMYFATDLWHVCIIRFLVAMGIGGEWAVGASLVAETFAKRARAYTSGMFHSSSVLGIWMATCVGIIVADLVGGQLHHPAIEVVAVEELLPVFRRRGAPVGGGRRLKS